MNERYFSDPVRVEDTVRRKLPGSPSAASFGKAGGDVSPANPPAWRLLHGEEREKLQGALAQGIRPQLEAQGGAAHLAEVARLLLEEMESILGDHLAACPECATRLGSLGTAAAFVKAWNGMRRDDLEPLPEGTIWLPPADLVIRSAAQSVNLTTDQLTKLVAEAVRAATQPAARKIVISKAADGSLTAETTSS